MLLCRQKKRGRRTLKPKKLILSRKGFDSGSGGCPNPIFPDGTMFSLPIPSGDREQFNDLQRGDVDIPSVVAGITNGRVNRRNRVHLDPDLNFDTYRHRKNCAAWQRWRGMLGQIGIAQGHLDKQGVGTGDVFLFFSIYRRVAETAQGWRFVRGAPELHLLWGWLQVDQKYEVADIRPNQLAWARHYPHLFSGYRGDQNTVYTDPNAAGVSQWWLPRWFLPDGRKPPLTYHADRKRWRHDANYAYLKSVGRGQEVVLDLAHYPEAVRWLADLLSSLGFTTPS